MGPAKLTWKSAGREENEDCEMEGSELSAVVTGSCAAVTSCCRGEGVLGDGVDGSSCLMRLAAGGELALRSALSELVDGLDCLRLRVEFQRFLIELSVLRHQQARFVNSKGLGVHCQARAVSEARHACKKSAGLGRARTGSHGNQGGRQ